MITISGEALDLLLGLKQKGIQFTGEDPAPTADHWWWCYACHGFHPGWNGKKDRCDLEEKIDKLVRQPA